MSTKKTTISNLNRTWTDQDIQILLVNFQHYQVSGQERFTQLHSDCLRHLIRKRYPNFRPQSNGDHIYYKLRYIATQIIAPDTPEKIAMVQTVTEYASIDYLSKVFEHLGLPLCKKRKFIELSNASEDGSAKDPVLLPVAKRICEAPITTPSQSCSFIPFHPSMQSPSTYPPSAHPSHNTVQHINIRQHTTMEVLSEIANIRSVAVTDKVPEKVTNPAVIHKTIKSPSMIAAYQTVLSLLKHSREYSAHIAEQIWQASQHSGPAREQINQLYPIFHAHMVNTEYFVELFQKLLQ